MFVDIDEVAPGSPEIRNDVMQVHYLADERDTHVSHSRSAAIVPHMSSRSDSEDSLLDCKVDHGRFHVAITYNSGRVQFWAAFSFALIAVFWNSAFQVLTEYVPKSLDNRLLPDLGHSLGNRLGNFLPNSAIVDVLLTVLLVVTLVRFLCFSSRAMSLVVLKRYLLLQGVIFTLRGPALYMTTLPPTLTDPKECFFASSGSFFLDTLLVVLRQKVTCTDLFFSGHSAMMLLWTLFMTAHTGPETFNSKRLYRVFTVAIWAVTVTALTLIPLTKFHYSIDVFVGVLLAFLLHRSYYDILFTLSFLRNSPMELSWTQHVVFWFETGHDKVFR